MTNKTKEQLAVDAYFSPERSESLSRALVAADRALRRERYRQITAPPGRCREHDELVASVEVVRERALERWLDFHSDMFRGECR